MVRRRRLHLLLRPLRLRRHPPEGRLGRGGGRRAAAPLWGLRQGPVLEAGRAVVTGVRLGGPVRVPLRRGHLGVRGQRACLGVRSLDHVRRVLRRRRVRLELRWSVSDAGVAEGAEWSETGWLVVGLLRFTGAHGRVLAASGELRVEGQERVRFKYIIHIIQTALLFGFLTGRPVLLKFCFSEGLGDRGVFEGGR